MFRNLRAIREARSPLGLGAAALLTLTSASACSADSESGSMGPTAGSGSTNGATMTLSTAGATTLGGTGTTGSSVQSTGSQGSGGVGGSSSAGSSSSSISAGGSGGSSSSGSSGSSGGGSGASASTGSSSSAGGSGASGGAGGSGGVGCDVAVYDPASPPQTLPLSGNLGTHDPVLIEADGIWYEFQTGPRIFGKTSPDLTNWEGTPSALGEANPAWIAERVPGATDLWAPDVSYFNQEYHLYYSASTFGSNGSCIGHATRASLSSGSWSDHGPVICSESENDFNAIDPNIIVDDAGTPWLAFGSFWDGIKAIELTQAGARAGDELHSLASRGGGAIEAPFIVRRCNYYYLFVSFDSCCQGADSTYNIRVGRSEQVLGPYLDQDGTALLDGGGTVLVSGDDTWKGPGHNAVIFAGTKAYNVYHAYRATDGAATLRISELAWDADGWPRSGGP